MILLYRSISYIFDNSGTQAALLIILSMHYSFLSLGQSTVQNIRGKLVEKESKSVLAGVLVYVKLPDGTLLSTQSDEEGYFKLTGVPVGRQTLRVEYLGYKTIVLSEIQVNAGKEPWFELEMEDDIKSLDEVTIVSEDKLRTVNDMAMVSARSFTVEEADKYPASRQDPARMAGNFAGVNSTSDARNDIVVRGNSPLGILWRVEDVDIPNPNHFAIAGSTGGPLSIINTKSLQTSDFMTGAFPAEYGNALAGVFDLRLRPGNTEKWEGTGQFGILGTELSLEGPIHKAKKSSFLGVFRYSTFQMLQFLNISLGTNAVPQYQDWGFKWQIFNTKKLGNLSFFSLGGFSKIDIVLSSKNERPEELFGDQNRDQYFRTNMQIYGLQHKKSLSNKLYLQTTLSYANQRIWSNHDIIYRDANYRVLSLHPILYYGQREQHASFNQHITHKISSRLSAKVGYYTKLYFFEIYDSARFDTTSRFRVRAQGVGKFILFQPFAQLKYKISEKTITTLGLRYQYMSLNADSRALEPRVAISHKIDEKHQLSLGLGLHAQMQPTYIYFISKGLDVYGEFNRGLGFSRSAHSVLTYDLQLNKSARVKVETYYQYLWDIPVYPYPSGISLINQGASFTRFFPNTTMVNAGKGQNYGVEFTVEKFFSKQYYILFTTSLFESKYLASDNKWRNTDFNGNYVTNALAGYELPLNKKKSTHLVTGTKITMAGGRRYSPANIDSSNKYLDLYPQEDKINTLRFKDYFRADLRVGVRANTKKLTHEFVLDLVNVFNTYNPLGIMYAPDPSDPSKDPIQTIPQLGRLPLFFYKLDF